MKIYFHKDYKNIYHIATEETGTGWWDACLLDIKNEYILKRITLLLQENFKSIVFKTELLFQINDVADEAFFIIWSNGGLDV